MKQLWLWNDSLLNKTRVFKAFGVKDYRAELEACKERKEREILWEKWNSTIGVEYNKRVNVLIGLSKSQYQLYLRSPEWQEKRQAVFERDGHKCRACSSTENLHAHHVTYDRKYNESLYDLVTLCATCHDFVHL
jgi:5-methylcytosine-specific restriction endonuclease McrA